MNIEEIQPFLTNRFGTTLTKIDDNSYQVETAEYRLMIILSGEKSWLRILIPIAPAADAITFIEQFLHANFDATLEVRYALYEDILWGVWQHSVAGLTMEDFSMAIERSIELKQVGIDRAFRDFATKQVREIARIAKKRGDTLEQTIQTLDRFYAEGVMGDLGATEDARTEMMTAWRFQLEKIWAE
jgi:hypothetical protein